MGYILSDDELGPEAGEYHGEVKRESISIGGEGTFIRTGTKRCPSGCDVEGSHVHADYGHVKQRHAITVYPASEDVNQGFIEIPTEDIPKLRAVLDAVERHLREREGGVPWENRTVEA